ncbi:MAG: hypothetical protein V3U98_03365 [Acidobacteriota bacterium]
MKRYLAVVAILWFTMPALVFAGKLEKALERRWLGAWAITRVETYSDCHARYTRNQVNGRFVNSSGRQRFRAGELAKVVKVDAKRSRLDLFLKVNEPLLMPRQEGPFTLYDEIYCKIELEIELTREMVKNRDVRQIEMNLRPVLERYATEDEARRAKSWNRREREAYPEDYQDTLAQHAIWKAEQVNATVQMAIDSALEQTSNLAQRLKSDGSYLSDFAKGVEAARRVKLRSCESMVSFDISGAQRAGNRSYGIRGTAAPAPSRAYLDGRTLVLGLQLLSRLPGCFVPVPVAGGTPVAARR